MFQEVFRVHVESDYFGEICCSAFIVFDSMSDFAGAGKCGNGYTCLLAKRTVRSTLLCNQ